MLKLCRDAFAVLFLSMSVTLAGCSAQSSPGLKIGVVNLETVATESGETEKFQQQAKAVESSLQGQLNQLRAAMVQQYEKKIAEFGPTPTDEQKKQLENMKAAQENQFGQANQQAQAQMGYMIQAMFEDFRKKMKPIVEALSVEEKFDLIVEDSGVVVAYDKKLDISSKVAARLKLEAMNAPEGQTPGIPQMAPAAAGPAKGAPGKSEAPSANDPLMKMLNSPSLPTTSAPAASTPAPAAPTSPAPATPTAPAETPKPDAPAEGGEAAKPAETPAGGN